MTTSSNTGFARVKEIALNYPESVDKINGIPVPLLAATACGILLDYVLHLRKADVGSEIIAQQSKLFKSLIATLSPALVNHPDFIAMNTAMRADINDVTGQQIF